MADGASSKVDGQPVVVVGAGFAGLATACRAAELGEQVVVMEAGADADYLCNSLLSGGVFHVAHHPFEEPPELLMEAIEKGTYGGTAPELGRLLAHNVGRAMTWLKAQGAEFESVPYVSLKALAPYNRDSERGAGPDRLLRRLRDVFASRGGRILFDHRVTDVVTDDGHVVGVHYRTADGEGELLTKAVVFADGGFQNNVELVKKHIAPEAESVAARNAGGCTGTALTLCEGLGAKLVHLDSFYGHLLSVDALNKEELSLNPQLDVLALSGLVVDREGRRFCDEGLGGVNLANTIARRSDPHAFIICDAPAWERAAGGMPSVPPNPDLENRGGTLHRADTVGELALLAGLPEEQLRATVHEFNRFTAGEPGTDLLVGRTGAGQLAGVREPPFVAVPVVAGITFTMGGPLIDRHARVQSDSGEPIQGVYVVGAAAGGFDGGADVGYAGGLSRGAVTALAAAEHIAGTPAA